MGEARVNAQIECLRRLPPGTEVHLARDQYAFLWEALSSLPAHVDPFTWAAGTGARQFALLTLRQCLEEAERLLQGGRQWRQNGFSLPSLAEALERLWTQAREVAPWDVANQSAEEADARMKELGAAAGAPRLRLPNASREEPRSLPLLADLLSLPDDVSPLQWLEEERAAACALRGWDTLVSVLRPLPEQLQVSSTIASDARLQGKASSLRGLKVIVEEVMYFRHGLALRLTTQLRPPQRLRHDHSGWLHWEGFDQAIDDRGYCYLVREVRVEHRGRSRFRYGEEKVTLVAYPSPAGAREIVWRSRPALSLLNRVSTDMAEVTPGAGLLDMGDVEWHMPVRFE